MSIKSLVNYFNQRKSFVDAVELIYIDVANGKYDKRNMRYQIILDILPSLILSYNIRYKVDIVLSEQDKHEFADILISSYEYWTDKQNTLLLN